MPHPDYLATVEVAEYLRLKERKVYDLVSQGVIPCVRVTGKLLFPRQRVDLWLMNHLEGDDAVSSTTPPLPAVGTSSMIFVVFYIKQKFQ